MITGYITILDIQEEKTHIYPIWLKNELELDLFLKTKGFNPDKINYMITDEIKFQIH